MTRNERRYMIMERNAEILKDWEELPRYIKNEWCLHLDEASLAAKYQLSVKTITRIVYGQLDLCRMAITLS